MRSQNHIIKRQVLEVELPSADNAWQYQNRISELYKQELVPVLEEVFDSLCRPGEVVRIDKLEIDLGALTAGSFEEQVREKLKAFLQDKFTPAVLRSARGESVVFNGTEIRKEVTSEISPAEDIRAEIRSKSFTALQLITHFLLTGNLPWWYEKSTYDTPAAVLEKFMEQSSPVFLERLGLLLRFPQVRKRVIFLLRDEEVEKLLQLYTPEANHSIIQAYRLLIAKQEEWFPGTASGREHRFNVWEAALLHLALGERTNAAVLTDRIKPEQDTSFPAEIRMLRQELLTERPALTRKNDAEGTALEENRKKEDRLPSPDPEDLADFYIDNGGLVLLWPYLTAFFTELGLVKEKKFADEAAAHRAVHLLHYLVFSGETEYSEADLVLNKILCGLGITEPVDMEFTISETEKNECGNLLQAVIDHWKAIGKISPPGFRNTFLRKPGALKKAENGWNLYMERTTVDMLLDRLPWGISIVKLPWSREVVYVEW